MTAVTTLALAVTGRRVFLTPARASLAVAGTVVNATVVLTTLNVTAASLVIALPATSLTAVALAFAALALRSGGALPAGSSAQMSVAQTSALAAGQLSPLAYVCPATAVTASACGALFTVSACGALFTVLVCGVLTGSRFAVAVGGGWLAVRDRTLARLVVVQSQRGAGAVRRLRSGTSRVAALSSGAVGGAVPGGGHLGTLEESLELFQVLHAFLHQLQALPRLAVTCNGKQISHVTFNAHQPCRL